MLKLFIRLEFENGEQSQQTANLLQDGIGALVGRQVLLSLQKGLGENGVVFPRVHRVKLMQYRHHVVAVPLAGSPVDPDAEVRVQVHSLFIRFSAPSGFICI